MHNQNTKGKLLKKRTELGKLVQDAEDISDKIHNFSFHQFEEKFFNAPNNTLDVYEAFERKIAILNENKQEGTKSTYEDALSSLKKFKNTLSFEDVTSDFLNKYEKWMLDQGRTYTTIGIYLRNLRAIFNIAINVDKIIDREVYPFTKYKFQIPKGSRGKITLSLKEIGLIDRYKGIPNSIQDRSKDFWLFSFYCQGINPKDIFNLKFKQLTNEGFSFKREKTIRTTKEDPIIVHVHLNTKAWEIINKWGNKDKNPDNYIFPYVYMGNSVSERRKSRKNFVDLVNDHIRSICKKVGIEKDVTTYVARHSYALAIINQGGTIEELRELLGHKDIKTTQNYVNDIIPSKKHKEYADSLMDFDIDKYK